jgi:hypothetical protein
MKLISNVRKISYVIGLITFAQKYSRYTVKGWESEALPEAKGTVRRPWTEEWTVRLCGVSGVVPMPFVPDATGTTIHSEVLKAPK